MVNWLDCKTSIPFFENPKTLCSKLMQYLDTLSLRGLLLYPLRAPVRFGVAGELDLVRPVGAHDIKVRLVVIAK